MLTWILLAIAVLAAGGGFLWRRNIVSKIQTDSPPDKKMKRRRALATMLVILGIYIMVTQIIHLIFGAAESEGMEFSLWPARVDLFGFSMSTTVISTWYAMAALIVVAIILRLTVVRKLRDLPSGAQNVLEIIVETISKYTNSQVHGIGEILGSYIFSIGALMVACAWLELFGLRAPTSDITMTFAMALVTFVLINWYGIKKKGVGGRIKSLASPTPVVFIIRVLTDLAIPVSMASRLFGNMLGGMIVMELVYVAFGHYAVGIPSLLGLYFNVFHPLIQAFIFITLTLTFINEAIE